MAGSGSRLQANVALAILIGLGLALFLSAFVVLLVVLQGTSVLEAYDTDLPTVVALYFLGGLVGGAIVGLLLPLGRRWFGAMILGYLGALPLYGMVAMVTTPASEWSTFIPQVLFYVAGPIGAVVGLALWFQFRSEGEI